MGALTGRVWVTRAQPGAARTTERLLAAGFAPLVDPLLETRDLPGETIDLAGVGALAFTSPNAVAAFARRSAARALPAYAVGEATAAAARAAGFADVRAGHADVNALAALIAGDPRRPAGFVLHPSAAETAGDLTGDLARQDVPAHRLAIYETVPRRPAPDTLAALPALAAVLLHSPKAARVLAEVLGQETLDRLAKTNPVSPGENHEAARRLVPPPRGGGGGPRSGGGGSPERGAAAVFCLSPAIAEALGGAIDEHRRFAIHAAPTPSDEALIALLRATVR